MRDMTADEGFARLLIGSHRRTVGHPLVDQATGRRPTAAWLYARAPFCLLAHDTAEDPCFIYANEAVQACFGYSREELIGLPSRLSAEAPDRAERQRLLDAVARDGCVTNYRGMRIAKSGRRFLIENATVWGLIDEAGVRHGQAAVFTSWRDADQH